MKGSMRIGAPFFVALQTRSTTASGVISGVSRGAFTPANMPVLMKLGHTVVTFTCP